jgi:hypothetical protein
MRDEPARRNVHHAVFDDSGTGVQFGLGGQVEALG